MTTPDRTPETTLDELDRHLTSGGRVLDVRNPDEYADAHIPDATLIPLPRARAATRRRPVRSARPRRLPVWAS